MVSAQVVPITIPNLQALQLSHGFGISSEFSVMQVRLLPRAARACPPNRGNLLTHVCCCVAGLALLP